MRFKENLLKIVLSIYVIMAIVVTIWHFALPDQGVLQFLILNKVSFVLQILVGVIFLTLLREWSKLQRIKSEIKRCDCKRNFKMRRGEGVK